MRAMANFPWRGTGWPGWRRRRPALCSAPRLKISTPIFARQTNILVAVAVFALVLLLRLSLPLTMAIMLPVSLFFAWRRAG